MGVVKLALLLILYTVIGALVFVFLPGIPPDMNIESYTITPPAQLKGKLAPNGILDRAELVFDGEFIGAESVAIRGDELYTGTIGGYIIRVKDGKWENLVQTGNECAGQWEALKCGRPLGLRFEPSGKLLVADAAKGLLRVDVDKKTVETIVPPYSKIEGTHAKVHFADDVDITSDGIIYFSDAGQHGDWDSIIDIIGEPTGMLLRYDSKTKKVEKLIDKLRFANGVQLSNKEDFLVISETGLGRVLKYHLKGANKGTHEVFIDGLPGYPDNIRSNGKGGFYISLVAARTEENPGFDKYADMPLVRKLIVRLEYVLLKALQTLYSYTPNEFVGKAMLYVKHQGPFGGLDKYLQKVIIVEVDESGNVLGSLQTENGQARHVSELSLGEKYSYLGSPFSPQLWRIRTEYLK